MTLKRKIAFNLSIAFSILFAVVMAVIYAMFSSFRKDEFQERFRERLDFTVNFIKNSKDFEKEAPLYFDENSDNFLLDEDILIFNQDKNLIYSTENPKDLKIDVSTLEYLDVKKKIYDESSSPEVYAVIKNINGDNYYIFTAAVDIYGNSKLRFLKYILILAYMLSCSLLWIFCYYIVGRFLRPLEDLNEQMSDITAHNLTMQMPEISSNDEIGILRKSFNTMTRRLDDVFQSQKDFTASASHEIRTPLTRMSFQVENLLLMSNLTAESKVVLAQLQKDIVQLSELTHSLLILTKFDKQHIHEVFELVRVDELVFDSFEKIKKNYPKLHIDFQIDDSIDDTDLLEINGVKSLLEIVFNNLLKNVAVYSDNALAKVVLGYNGWQLTIDFISDGAVLSAEDQKRIFSAFMRGNNANNTPGSGLGLKISQRILEYHDAKIEYHVSVDHQNLFRLIF